MSKSRWLVVAVAVMLAAVMAGCGGSGGTSADKVESGPLTAQDVQAALDGPFAAEAWSDGVTGVTEETLLRRPVVVVKFKDDATANQGFTSLQTSLSAQYPGKAAVVECAGKSMPMWATMGGGQMEKVALPASPGSAQDFLGWLESAFGKGSPKPEAWVARVKKAEYAQETEDGWTNALVLTTDLAFDAEGMRQASIVQQAVIAAKPTFATTLVVRFSDGKVLAGDINAAFGGFGY